MSKIRALDKIKKEYLESYKIIHKKDERIIFFKRLKKEAEKYNLKEYINFFNGFINLLEKKYEESIRFFKESIKINYKFAYPWHGLGNVYGKLKEYQKAIDCFNKAIKLDDKFAYPWHGLGNVYLKLKEYQKVIDCYNKATKLDDKYAYPWNGLGNVYAKSKEYQKAIEYYNKAIKIDDKYASPLNGLGNVYYELKEYQTAIYYYNKSKKLDDKYAYPWSGLGNVYYELKEYQKAIDCYNKSIKLDDKLAVPWSNLGTVYGKLNDYQKAIICYKKAIEIDDKYVVPWNGLGIVNKKLKEYKKAIDCYNKAIKLDDKFGEPLYNLGLLYDELNKYQKAIDFYEKALQLFKKEKDNYLISNTKDRIKESKKGIKSEEIFKKKEELLKFGAVAEILNRTIKDGIENKSIENKKQFLNFLDEKIDIGNKEIYFQVLRRWNSYTPIIPDNYHISKGGGYFLKAKTKGIVIDPGFNFIDNFKGSKHKFNEIDTIFISHAHNDHTSDLESILTLLNEYNQEIKDSSDTSKDNTIRKEIAKRKKTAPNKVTKEEIDKEFIDSKRRKKLDFYITLSVFKKYSGLFELFTNNDYRIHTIEKGDKIKIDDEITVEVIGAKHYDIISDRDSIGMIISCKNCAIFYTGDTGWDSEIEKQFKKIAKIYKSNYKLLVAHLGGFKEYEKDYLTSRNKEETFYKDHLGRLGLAKINEVIEPDICFISEFGEELKGERIEFAKICQNAFDNKIIFLPADIGLKYNLVTKKIKAITAINAETKELSFDYIKPEKVKTYLFRTDYSLHYYKNAPSLKEGDLEHVLGKQFEKSNK